MFIEAQCTEAKNWKPSKSSISWQMERQIVVCRYAGTERCPPLHTALFGRMSLQGGESCSTEIIWGSSVWETYFFSSVCSFNHLYQYGLLDILLYTSFYNPVLHYLFCCSDCVCILHCLIPGTTTWARLSPPLESPPRILFLPGALVSFLGE